MFTKTLLLFTLLTIGGVRANVNSFDAMTDGFVHAVVKDVVKEPVDSVLNPSVKTYYVCSETGSTQYDFMTSQEKCYDNIVDYTVIIPPNPIAVFLANLLIILVFIASIVWCFTSTCEEKIDALYYIMCHLIGQIIYDILCGDDND